MICGLSELQLLCCWLLFRAKHPDRTSSAFVRLTAAATATCNLSPYNVKLPHHYRILYVAPQKNYLHENYRICFMLFLTPEHILITFAFGVKSKGISNICTDRVLIQHFKKRGLPIFSDHREPCLKTNIINLDVVSNKHVYLLKIKLLIQQMQSQDLKKNLSQI